jgi:hypothetical protein
MLANYRYLGSSSVQSTAHATQMSFSPDASRSPTFFRAELALHLPFREAISALHDVVVSDLRFQPKDRTAYKEWAAQHLKTLLDLDLIASQRADLAVRVAALQAELNTLTARSFKRKGLFWRAQSDYFSHLFRTNLKVFRLFDPVITVHPDEVFFECFSKDESTYARLSASYDVFKNIHDVSCGTTNVDYSEDLYKEFQKIRDYKRTDFQVDPSGFEVQTQHEDLYKEVKIDLPDSWVRGFLQVNSAMSLPSTRVSLHPMDVFDICALLRRKKEKVGPRSLRFILQPGQPVRLCFDPWNIQLTCRRSTYTGSEPMEVRIWGRRRLLTLERLIPIARSFTVHLLGSGMPSFYVADLGPLSFTLGLSGWTSNDWSSSSQFDLLAPRAQVDPLTQKLVFDTLKQSWFATPDAIAARCGRDRATVLGALGAFTQAGRAIFDINKDVYRARELSQDPLPLSSLRFSSDREASAERLLLSNTVRDFSSRYDPSSNLHLSASITQKNDTYSPSLTIDQDQKIILAECSCFWYKQNKLLKGPCEHMLALRMFHARQMNHHLFH